LIDIPASLKIQLSVLHKRSKSHLVVAFGIALCRIQQRSNRFAIEQGRHMKTYGNS